ncbi:putative repeat protein (TIGR03943 family) [Bacillus pakistanensis]|uniref:Repeat protein (TIGR03943 family) n=1 Tax=Rossellomorea pakistanensis TaxID=992288 RepID=A0ABS2NGR9_9BACI|nr:TIGR03943 family protein [Bacillus pakistanensis]MBM7587030.1 putative repeat protein (TIGR03943 family) [Bacillus pakistanensis]
MNSQHRFHTFIRGIILIGYALMIFKLFITFNLQNFVASKMHLYLYFGLGVFIFLGAVQVIRGTSADGEENQCGCGGHELPKGAFRSILIYSLFVLPILAGFLFPSNLLDSTVAAKRGVKYGEGLFTKLPSSSEKSSEEASEDPKEIKFNITPTIDHNANFPIESDFEKLKELVHAAEKIYVREEQFIPTLSIINENAEEFIGREIQMTGFVYKDESFSEDEIVVSRFTITCCVADASVYGLLAKDASLSKLESDKWIKVSGIIDTIEFNGSKMPVIKNPVYEVIQVPKNPYVEEFYMRIE